MAKTGVVPEDPDAPPSMTARQLSAFCAKLYPTWDVPSVEARLARFGVPAGTPYRSLSKGQRALVALALALASSPELLVLDDPTLGLDAVARRAFFEELSASWRTVGRPSSSRRTTSQASKAWRRTSGS